MQSIATAHQYGITDTRLLSPDNFGSPRHETGGHSQIDVRGPRVWQDSISVEMFLARVRILQEHGARPSAEVRAGASHDIAHSIAALAVVFHIAATLRVVKGEVLRIKGSIRDGSMIEQFTPAHTVRGTKNSKAFAMMGVSDRLESLVLRCRRVGIKKRSEVMRTDPLPDDVVFF